MMTSITSLPVELVARIAEFTDPFTHLDLACTSSYIAASMTDILKRHRAEYARMPCSDLHPLAIPRLLRNVIVDPVAAYHLKTINIWCARQNWSHWRAFQLHALAGPDVDFFEPEETPASWTYRPDEMEVYLNLLGQHLEAFEEGSEFRELARDELARGDDGVFKALLILLCPRLRTVNFARTSYVPTEEASEVGNTTLAWLCRVAVSHRDQNIRMWPAGLRSLRHLAVGVETGTQFDSHIRQVYHPLFMAKLLNMPNLESMYLYGLGYHGLYDSDDEHVEGYPLTPGCSSVRHIYVEHLENLGLGFWRHVARACKNQLTSVAFHGGESQDIDDYVAASAKEGLNLQSMMCYGSGLTGYRYDLYPPKETLGGYHSSGDIRVLTVSIADLELEARQQRVTCEQDLIDYLIGGCEDPSLPNSVEVLVLAGNLERLPTYITGERVNRVEETADLLDNVLAAMITGTEADKERNRRRVRGERAIKGRANRECNFRRDSVLPEQESSLEPTVCTSIQQVDGTAEDEEYVEDEDDDDMDGAGGHKHIYPNLKAIYIEPWQGRETPAAMQSSSRLWFQKSIQAGLKRAVDVRTRTNVNPPIHRDLQFHMAPDRFDLRPDLAPPDNHEFDPLQGRWVDRGCGNCGNCVDCFAFFPKELWTRAYRAPKRAAKRVEATKQYGEGRANDRVKDGTGEEIFTRISREMEPEQWQMGYRIQRLDQYAKDRCCPGEDDLSGLSQGLPPIRLPETARGRGFCRA